MRGDEVDLVLREESLHRRRSGPVDQLLPERGILGALEQRNPFGRRANAFLREAYRHLVAFRLGIERVDNKENAGAGLTQANRQRSPATAFGIQLHVGPQFFHIVERLVLIAAVDLEHGENARNRRSGGPRVGHLQHVLVRRREQIVPRRRRLEAVLLDELVVGHEHQRIIGDGDPLSIGVPETGGKRREGRRLVRLEQSLVDPGGESFHRPAEEHIHTRIVLFGNDAGERLA